MGLRITKTFLLIPFVALIFGVNEAQSSSLKSVQIIFRHGQRIPDTSYVTTTGGLTELGKKQMYELGVYIRKRYPTLLKTEFDAEETSIISSDTDRTLRSAALVAYGLYEDFNLAADWNGEDNPIPFEPIPVRAIPPELDRYLQPKVPCARLNQLLISTVTPYFEDLLERHSELLDTYVKEWNDNDFKNRDLNIQSRIVTFLSFMEQASFNTTHGLPLRDWTVEMLKLDDFRFLMIDLFKAIYVLPEERKLYAGSLLGLVTNGLKDQNPKKVALYSGHDRVMYALMRLLDIFDPLGLHPPPLGASLMFELHQEAQNGRQQKEYVKIFYRNDTQVEPEELKVPNCENPCLLSTFLKNSQALIPVDYEEECQVRSSLLLQSEHVSEKRISGNTISSWIYGVVGAAAVLSVLVAAVMFTAASKKKHYFAV